MSGPTRESTTRTFISWLEIAVGAGFIAIGIGYLVPVVRDGLGDPHGMGGAMSLLSSALGVCLLVAGLVLRIRATWAWIAQILPVLVVALLLIVVE